MAPDVWFAKDVSRIRDATGSDGPDVIKRYRCCVSNNQYYTYQLSLIHERIVQTLQLQQHWIDPLFGFLACVVFPGGGVQPHNDSYILNYENGSVGKFFMDKIHIRFVVMVDREDDVSYDPHIVTNIERDPSSSRLIISKYATRVDIKSAWCFPAGHMEHMTPFIKGDTPRITYQFGFAIPNTVGIDLNRLLEIRQGWLK